MSKTQEIQAIAGFVKPGFEPVKQVFLENFTAEGDWGGLLRLVPRGKNSRSLG